MNIIDADVQKQTQKWIKVALQNPERVSYREDIENFRLAESGSATSTLTKSCENVVTVGGIYNWTKVRFFCRKLNYRENLVGVYLYANDKSC